MIIVVVVIVVFMFIVFRPRHFCCCYCHCRRRRRRNIYKERTTSVIKINIIILLFFLFFLLFLRTSWFSYRAIPVKIDYSYSFFSRFNNILCHIPLILHFLRWSIVDGNRQDEKGKEKKPKIYHYEVNNKFPLLLLLRWLIILVMETPDATSSHIQHTHRIRHEKNKN